MTPVLWLFVTAIPNVWRHSVDASRHNAENSTTICEWFPTFQNSYAIILITIHTLIHVLPCFRDNSQNDILAFVQCFESQTMFLSRIYIIRLVSCASFKTTIILTINVVTKSFHVVQLVETFSFLKVSNFFICSLIFETTLKVGTRKTSNFLPERESLRDNLLHVFFFNVYIHTWRENGRKLFDRTQPSVPSISKVYLSVYKKAPRTLT